MTDNTKGKSQNPTLVPHLTWCLACQRVSWSMQFEGIYWACPYEDCPFYADLTHTNCVRGVSWAHLWYNFHPEFPYVARQGVVYPAPKLIADVAAKEPNNPFLKVHYAVV